MSKVLRIRELVKQFKRYQFEIMRLLETHIVPDNVNLSLDANQLSPGLTATDLIQPALDSLAAHEARFDNPHGESAESLGDTYSRGYIMEQLAGLVGPGIIPVSTWGYDKPHSELLPVDAVGIDYRHWHMGVDTGVAGSLALYKISCKSTFKGMLSGTPYTIGPQDVYIPIINSSGSSRCHYAVDLVRGKDGSVRYEARPMFDVDLNVGDMSTYLSLDTERLTLFNVYVQGRTSTVRAKRITSPLDGGADAGWGNFKIRPIQPVFRLGTDYLLTYSVAGSKVPRIPHTAGRHHDQPVLPIEIKP